MWYAHSVSFISISKCFWPIYYQKYHFSLSLSFEFAYRTQYTRQNKFIDCSHLFVLILDWIVQLKLIILSLAFTTTSNQLNEMKMWKMNISLENTFQFFLFADGKREMKRTTCEILKNEECMWHVITLPSIHFCIFPYNMYVCIKKYRKLVLCGIVSFYLVPSAHKPLKKPQTKLHSKMTFSSSIRWFKIFLRLRRFVFTIYTSSTEKSEWRKNYVYSVTLYYVYYISSSSQSRHTHFRFNLKILKFFCFVFYSLFRFSWWKMWIFLSQSGSNVPRHTSVHCRSLVYCTLKSI